ncbi:MAG: hypothetical protein ACJAXJ_002051 [Colwellia sp.]|jgi:hypothetical protein
MNPFVFSGASNLSNEQILNLFIHDYNYSRFIQSKRNFFFWGERGAGKTMTLLYNKLVMLENVKTAISNKSAIEYIPVYVSCITPLVFKREYLLLDNKFKASVVSEHYLALSMALGLIDGLLEIPDIFELINQDEVKLELDYLLDDVLPEASNILKSIKLFLRKQFIQTQREINSPQSDNFYSDTYTFSSLLIPMMDIFRSMENMNSVHFVFMMDDAHDLNSDQRESLNSWIAYRDNSTFSFKVSAAKVSEYSLATTSGGAILHGHDYVSVNMEQAFQNNDSSYGKMATKIISRRLELAGFPSDFDPAMFFPLGEKIDEDITNCRNKARVLAVEKYGDSDKKKINDYIYKYARAIYFRERSSKANRVQYSGLETIIHLSSGVIRNLLEPCYVMYEDMISEVGLDTHISKITSKTQASVISRMSDSFWARLRHGVDKELPDCTAEQAKQVSNLFHALADLFRNRLLDPNCSEPRAIAFTISAKTDAIMMELQPILNLGRSAQLLYSRSGTAKDKGAKEDYFVPNRMLWPSRGLDPVGQHARVSIKAERLLESLQTGKIEYKPRVNQGELSQAKVIEEDRQEDMFSGSL